MDPFLAEAAPSGGTFHTWRVLGWVRSKQSLAKLRPKPLEPHPKTCPGPLHPPSFPCPVCPASSKIHQAGTFQPSGVPDVKTNQPYSHEGIKCINTCINTYICVFIYLFYIDRLLHLHCSLSWPRRSFGKETAASSLRIPTPVKIPP